MTNMNGKLSRSLLHSCFIMLLTFLISSFQINAQWTGEIRYAWLHSPEMDKTIQLYNFSRPWNEKKLTPLTHGYGATLGLNWKLHHFRQLHMVPQLGYYWYGTSAQNFDVTKSAGFHLLSFSTVFRYHPRALIKGIQVCGPLGPRWFLTTTPQFNFFMPFVRTDGELLFVEEGEKYRPIKGAFSLGMGTGYHLLTVGNFIITPEISATWYPKVELTDFTEMLNGHNVTGIDNEFKNMFLFQGYIRLTWIRPNTDWWDRPRSGDKS
jgi:hypothetical protein